ncbi:MAG: vWA domain-containing protein [Gemmataceae bacterium]
MVIVLATVAAVLVSLVAEVIHARRVARLAPLAFGPNRRPAHWAYAAPFLRATAVGLLVWGLGTLYLLKPKVHKQGVVAEKDIRYLVLVLDVSPSMRLQDAGPTAKQSRAKRAADLMTSFFERVPIEKYKMSVIAVYTDAKPVVVNTTDMEVVRNILSDLPMEFAFKPGPTNLFAGLEEAARIAAPLPPASATLVVVSDGDTIPPTGMPKMPASVSGTLIIGVGDPRAGKYVDGHQSRQDASTLRQLAARMRGTYHDGNEKHLSTELVRSVSGRAGEAFYERLGIRELALAAVALGASILALLPLALHYLGTRWKPGVPVRRPSLTAASFAKS